MENSLELCGNNTRVTVTLDDDEKVIQVCDLDEKSLFKVSGFTEHDWTLFKAGWVLGQLD